MYARPRSRICGPGQSSTLSASLKTFPSSAGERYLLSTYHSWRISGRKRSSSPTILAGFSGFKPNMVFFLFQSPAAIAMSGFDIVKNQDRLRFLASSVDALSSLDLMIFAIYLPPLADLTLDSSGVDATL